MKLKRKISFLLFVLSFIFLCFGINFNITGNAVQDYFNGQFLPIHFIGFLILICAFFFFYENKSLDYLLIPTGWEKQRKQRALEELAKRDVKNILILNGNDSEEDILYLGKKLKGKKKMKIGFDTFPLHYDEYKEIIKKAQKQGKFPKRVKIENVNTGQTAKEFIYGILGLTEEKLNNKIDYEKNKQENYFIKKTRKFVKKILK